MTAPPRIAALVVTHQRLTQLKVTLARLLAEPLDHVVVFDNASTDGTAAFLAEQSDPRLHVVGCAENLGGAGGFAGAIAAARARFDPDWFVLMDDDARPEPGAIAAFRARLPVDADAVAAAVLYPDGGICPMNRPLKNPFRLRGFRLPDAAFAATAPPRPADMASFVGLFLSRAAVAAAGLPDARLFLYGDDQLYTLRLTQSGHRLLFDPGIRFAHDCATLAARPGVYTPVWKAYYTYRNGILLYRQAAGPLALGLVALRLPRWLWAARRYGPARRTYLRLVRAALRDGIAGRLDAPPPGVPGPRQPPP